MFGEHIRCIFLVLRREKGVRKRLLAKQGGSFIKHNVGRRGNGQAHGSSFVLQSKHDKWGRVWHD